MKRFAHYSVVPILYFLLLGCVSVPHADTNPMLAARAQAETGVRAVKARYAPADPEYKEGRTNYENLRTYYDCWMEQAKSAIKIGKRPKSARDLQRCGLEAEEARRKFVMSVERAQENSETNLSLDTETASKYAAIAASAAAFFDKLWEAITKVHTWREQQRALKIASEIARIDECRWKHFDDIN